MNKEGGGVLDHRLASWGRGLLMRWSPPPHSAKIFKKWAFLVWGSLLTLNFYGPPICSTGSMRWSPLNPLADLCTGSSNRTWLGLYLNIFNQKYELVTHFSKEIFLDTTNWRDATPLPLVHIWTDTTFQLFFNKFSSYLHKLSYRPG